MRPDLAHLEQEAAQVGLLLRGAFHPTPEDAVPPRTDGRPAATVVLLGNAGAAMWHQFRRSPEARDGAPHGIDRWTRRTIAEIAAAHGAAALFPFQGPPYLPFLRWAMRAEPVVPSPLGMLIHPEYGLWHAYRGALTFAERLEIPKVPDTPPPCASCTGKPCLHACPVAAFTPEGYDVAACRAHIVQPQGADCLTGGCLARRACPVGRAYLYEAEQAAWHMAAFAGPAHGTQGEA